MYKKHTTSSHKQQILEKLMKNKNILKALYYPIGIFIVLIIFVRIFFPVYNIASESMEPTIKKGDYIVVNKLNYLFSDPKKNDIVLFEPIEDYFELGPWTHRVIATEGDNVSINNKTITVNNQDIIFSEIEHENLSILVQENHVFQKGDNKKTIAGTTPTNKIIGKILFSF